MSTTPRATTTTTTTELTPRQALDAGNQDLDRVEVYIDERGEYQWRRTTGGTTEPVSTSSEAYLEVALAEDSALRHNAAPFLFTTIDKPDQVLLIDDTAG